MGHHIADQGVGGQREGDALAPHGPRAEGYHLRIVPENGDQLGGKDQSRYGDHDQKDRAPFDTEPEALTDPVIELGTVVEAAYRLEALPEADQCRVGGGHHTADHAHGGNRGITVIPGSHIQTDGRHRHQALTAQAGKAAPQDLLENVAGKADLFGVQPQIAALRTAEQQQGKGAQLADDGGQRRTGNAHTEGEDQQRIQPYVDDRAGYNADHAVHGAALEAQLVVQHEGGGHIGSPQQDDPQVVAGIGQNGVR